MSTFSGLNTAYTGLSAARQALNVASQNVANAGTEGYTRQRLETSAAGPAGRTGLFADAPSAGQGVSVDGIARLGNAYLDARARADTASAGYTAVRAEVHISLEDVLNEPGENGLSAQLQRFWGAWQDLANQAGEAAPTNAVLQEAGALAAQLGRGYGDIDALWSRTRSGVSGMADQLNAAAAQVADLNIRIRTTLSAGGSVNELIDQRSLITADIASMAGGTVRDNADGTVDVFIGGNTLVSADRYRTVQVAGSNRMEGASTARVQLEWTHRPGPAVGLESGEMAGSLSLLAPASGGSGGAIAEAAASYNAFAEKLSSTVNTLHRGGSSVNGSTGLDFFKFSPGLAPAAGLGVVPTDASGLATGRAGAGPFDGGNADAISQINAGADSPDDAWNTFVIQLGSAARAELQRGVLAEAAANTAKDMQLSQAAVSLDEENVSLLSNQHAYQAAARVMTAIDEMLDVLINRTGLVGR
ncbi:flagellar hook-associated protein FlgK [Pseudarthrobacter sp. NPDC092424]|uniref:flagellar hook-associated protein FlgK n=1 Tax=Pseudarthrobacter sp. NPDC092424 TaxID=3364415 RepID=UPI00380E80AD